MSRHSEGNFDTWTLSTGSKNIFLVHLFILSALYHRPCFVIRKVILTPGHRLQKSINNLSVLMLYTKCVVS
ncbi:hypothetical protein TSAR_000841 [Trichomalopsis sarcophagae]|uniref:Uncharacterized protein n=1 Tax=Trichomalopsis sarcophagae TaxID=543379 RepID=A0A232EVZ9_9HYME|nr:hypothetical protein TSAR_000841 [Trichomalopsis sarcophagae]